MAEFDDTYKLLTTDERFKSDFEALQKIVLHNLSIIEPGNDYINQPVDTPLINAHNEKELKDFIKNRFKELFYITAGGSAEDAARTIISGLLFCAMTDLLAGKLVSKTIPPTQDKIYDAVDANGSARSFFLQPAVLNPQLELASFYVKTLSNTNNAPKFQGTIDFSFKSRYSWVYSELLGKELLDRKIDVKLSNKAGKVFKEFTITLRELSKDLTLDYAREIIARVKN